MDLDFEDLKGANSALKIAVLDSGDILQWLLENSKLRDDPDGKNALSIAHEFNRADIPLLLRYNQYSTESLVENLTYLSEEYDDEDLLKLIRNIYSTVLSTQNTGREAINQIIAKWNNPELVAMYLPKL